jgi:hypothetical protein
VLIKHDHNVHPHTKFVFVGLDKKIICPRNLTFEVSFVQYLDLLFFLCGRRLSLQLGYSVPQLLFENIQGVFDRGVSCNMNTTPKIISQFR